MHSRRLPPTDPAARRSLGKLTPSPSCDLSSHVGCPRHVCSQQMMACCSLKQLNGVLDVAPGSSTRTSRLDWENSSAQGGEPRVARWSGRPTVTARRGTCCVRLTGIGYWWTGSQGRTMDLRSMTSATTSFKPTRCLVARRSSRLSTEFAVGVETLERPLQRMLPRPICARKIVSDS